MRDFMKQKRGMSERADIIQDSPVFPSSSTNATQTFPDPTLHQRQWAVV